MQTIIHRTVSDQFLSDILYIAVEGGIDYWAAIVNLQAKGRGINKICTSVDIYDTNPDGGRWRVHHEDVARGIRLALDPKTNIDSTIRHAIQDGVINDDASFIDSIAADCIIQLATLGDIIYG